MGNESDKVPIYVSKSLYQIIEQRVKDSNGEFRNVEELVEFVLNEVLKEEETEPDQVYTKEDEEAIKQRLKSLGYL
jgi:hypothetical protein